MEKKTPLYEIHKKYKGMMTSFAGYCLPVQYEKGIIEEHMAVRNGCGMFDVSHMGEIICEGKKAEDLLNFLLTNEFRGMQDGQARYSVMCYESGGCVDDLIVYKQSEGKYFIVVNAANKDEDFLWFKAHEKEGAVFTDVSAEYAQIAVQGPLAKEILQKIFSEDMFPKKYYTANFSAEIEGVGCIISKTGYTGSDGYEIYISASEAEKIWEQIMEKGSEKGLLPCGLGARDTLRLEAGMPLYGHELSKGITPLEASLGSVVKFEKDNFIGKEALLSVPCARKRIGLKAIGRGVLREHMDVYHNDKKIGYTTSGTMAPYLGYSVAMALIEKEYANEKDDFWVDVRGRKVEVESAELPFYKKNK